MEALYKYSFGKMGYNQNEQEIASQNLMKLINNPNLNKIQNELQNEKNLNNKINQENIPKKK